MAGNFKIGAGLQLDGEKQFKDAVKSINKELYLLGTETKKVTAQFNANSGSLSALTAKHDAFQRSAEEQRKKIDLMKVALEEAKKEYGENSDQVRSWQIQINKAETELAKTEKTLNETTGQMDEFGKESKDGGDAIEKAGKKAEDSEGRFNKLGGVLKGVVVAMGAVVTAAAAAAIKLGKEVVEAYSEYEQLVGGIDTLFKESSAAMQEYASNAYKTAGLSANEYMETVTSFSASLIQSLGGDTEKAVAYADMAITDMSDNANKMGTDMASIQNAYQGFAKQNYTMLDNLKLGYGGTKEEMARLLADATAISGIEYDVSSYADIVDAIHVIQNEMGITGTTALEAEHTISGSIGSLESAISNLVIGFGDANADMEQLAGNVVDAFKDVVNNITPVVQNIVSALPVVTDALLTALAELLPMLLTTVTTLFQQVLSTLIGLLPTLIPAAVDAVLTIVQAVIDNLPALLDAALQIVLALAEGLSVALPELIPAAVEAVTEFALMLVDNIDLLVDAALSLVMGLMNGVITAIPVLLKAAPVIIQKLVDALINNIPKLLSAAVDLILALQFAMLENLPLILSAGIQILEALITGIVKHITNIPKVAIDIIEKIKEKFGSFDWASLGRNIIDGIKNGIIKSASKIADAAKQAAKAALDGVKNLLGIRSPSKVMEDEVGAMMGEGIGEGFVGSMGAVTRQMQSAIPTSFDGPAITGAAMSRAGAGGSYGGWSADTLADAFVAALDRRGLYVKANGRVIGQVVAGEMDKMRRDGGMAKGAPAWAIG